MKNLIIICALFAITVAGIKTTEAQTCAPTPPVCVATGNQPAFTYSNNTNFRLQFNDMPGVTEYQFTNGSMNRVVGINAINGNLSFGPNGALQVDANRPAFQFSGDADAGLYFTAGSPNQYQFRSLTGANVFTIDENDGDLTTTGAVIAAGGNSSQWNQAYGWGNHATGGYLTGESDPTINVTGSNSVPRFNGTNLVNGSILDNGVGHISVGVGIIDTNARLRAERPFQEFGAGKSSIYGVRNGSSLSALNGGTGWGLSTSDVAIKGFSNWGNQYSAAVHGVAYMDFDLSAAVIGSNTSGSVFGALGYNTNGKIYGSYINGDSYFTGEAFIGDRVEITDFPLAAGTYADAKLVVNGGGITIGWGHNGDTYSNIYSTNKVGNPTTPGFFSGSRSITALVAGDNSETKVAVNALAGGNAGTKIGLYGSVTGDGVVYGVRAFAAVLNSSTGYSIYGSGFVPGAGTHYAGYFSGNVTVTGTFSNPSDKKLKKDVQNMDNALETLSRLKAKTYYYDRDKYGFMGLSDKKQFGFIAQDVERILPQLVNEEIHPESLKFAEDGENHGQEQKEHEAVEYKSVNYMGMIPILVEAVNELKEEVDTKDEVIHQLMNRMDDLENALSACCIQQSSGNQPTQQSTDQQINKSTNVELADKAVLMQNVPNPFGQSTMIRYYVPESISSARISVFDMAGKEIQTFELNKGNGQVEFQTGDLASGQYMYSMILDGKVIATKQMILR